MKKHLFCVFALMLALNISAQTPGTPVESFGTEGIVLFDVNPSYDEARDDRKQLVIHQKQRKTHIRRTVVKIGICTPVVILSERSESKDLRTWFVPRSR